MNLVDIIATIDISILLFVFILNTWNSIFDDRKAYDILNIIGVDNRPVLPSFYPIVMLEAVWIIVGALSLFKTFHVKRLKLSSCFT